MRLFLLFVLLTSYLYSFEQVPFDYQRDFKATLEKAKDKSGELYYQKLLIRFLDNDSSLTRAETLALMIGFTEDKNYKPYKDMGTEKEIFDLNESGEYQEALDASKDYLQKHPLSLRILKERSYAYHQLNKEDSAKYFMALVDKIMGAMIYSGKGRKIEAPIFSLGLSDGEYFVANIGMTATGRNTAWDAHKNFIFIVDALSDDGEHSNFYFNIHHAKIKIEDEGVDEDTPEAKAKKKSKKKVKGSKPAADPIPAP